LRAWGATDESAAQERAANARAISACQSELRIIAMIAASWACTSGASILIPKRALTRLRRASKFLRGRIRLDYDVTLSVCHQVACVAIEYRDLSERLTHTIATQLWQAASG
jgi:hypothetical protein